MKKTIITFVLIITVYSFSFAQNTSDFIFDENGTITNYIGQETAIIIPEKINNIQVTVIGENAFEKKELTSVILPNGLISIDEFAFCENKLTSIIIPDSVINIGIMAFAINQLTSIVIPDSVTSMRQLAFAENKLNNVVIGRGLRIIEGSVFYKNEITSIVLPPNIIQVNDSSFARNVLTSITVGNNVYFEGSYFNLEIDFFSHFYFMNGKRAGIYEHKNGKWTFTVLRNM